MTKIHKVSPTKLKKNYKDFEVTNSHKLVKAYYLGNHPHLINAIGTATWDEHQQSWLFKPEVLHAEWYRVKAKNLTFEETTSA